MKQYRKDVAVARTQRALRNGANVNESRSVSTNLLEACEEGHDDIVRILLDAGANARWKINGGWSAMFAAIKNGRLPIVEMLINHDNGLLEIVNKVGETPLQAAIDYKQFEIVHLLLERGANALVTNGYGRTTLMLACCNRADLEIVRRLLAAGVSVEARDKDQCTALHHAVPWGNFGTIRELIIGRNANMFALNKYGETPFDSIRLYDSSAGKRYSVLIGCYSNKLIQEQGRLALHAIFTAAEYSFAKDEPPENALQIRLPLGKLTVQHFRTLLSTLGTELIRNRDESGKLPIHIACQNKAPVKVLALILEHDTATLQMVDANGALPIHDCCCGAVDDSSVRFLVRQGGVSTLAARNQDGAMPLHVLCGSTNPSLRSVQFLIQSYPKALAARTKAGQYPLLIAASSTASLSVVYGLVRTNPDLDALH